METFLDKHLAVIEANKLGKPLKQPTPVPTLIFPCHDAADDLGKIPISKKRSINKPVRQKRITGERQEIINLVAEKKSGGCIICGYNRCKASLNFHHTNPKTKAFSISRAMNYSISEVLLELDKCILVCANCHGEIHSGILGHFA